MVVPPLSSESGGNVLPMRISNGPVPERLKAIVSAPGATFASLMAARRVQVPPEVAQTPFPGALSSPSPVELTTSVSPAAVAADASGSGA